MLRCLLTPRPGAALLTTLDLTGCKGVSPGMVAAVCAAQPALERVWASGGQRWTPEAAAQLVATAGRLREFDVDVRASGVSALLLRQLGGLTPVRVKALTFRGLVRDPHVAFELASVLQTNASLTSVELKGRIHWRGLPPVLQACAENGGIRALTLDSVGIGADEATFLAGHLAEQAPHITQLCLRGNALGDHGIAALSSRWLARDATLRSLDLTRTAAGAKAAAALAAAAGHARSRLRVLTLAGNAGLGSAEAHAALAHLVARSPSLEALDLSFTSLSFADNLRPLARTLAEDAPSLRRLVLRGNRVGNEGATLLARALRANAGLRALDLGDNGISAEGARDLAAAARANATLAELALEVNDLSDAGMRALEAARSEALTLFI